MLEDVLAHHHCVVDQQADRDRQLQCVNAHLQASAHPFILVGDLNIAPLEHDVWSHKQLLKIVSHTPVEVDALNTLALACRKRGLDCALLDLRTLHPRAVHALPVGDDHVDLHRGRARGVGVGNALRRGAQALGLAESVGTIAPGKRADLVWLRANPAVDISSVVRFGRGQKVIGYRFTDDRRRTVYFDPEYSKLATVLGKAVGDQPVVTFEEASADGNKLLVFAHADKRPGGYYLFDKTSKEFVLVGLVRPHLENTTLASVKPIMVPAPDGTRIPAYLTLPPKGEGKNLPAVVLPHGGPSARDEWTFDWLAQFLAARGYAVIQPNFRGSAGYGDAWMGENAFRNWRQAIADVSASARYLVNEGIADADRLAIVGWSYGGYAALQSAAVDPALYKAAVAIAPVTDLSLLKKEAEGFTNARLVNEMIGSGAHLREGSPLRNAAAIKVPVLLVHGDMDANVGIAHSDRMHSALTQAGGKSELMRFASLDHQLDDSEARVRMLTRMGEFLDAAIGH